MTDQPDFLFNEKTCELSRGGKIISLCRLHAEMFGCFVDAAKQGCRISAATIATSINMPAHAIEREFQVLAARLKRLGIRLGSERAHKGQIGGRWLIIEEMPKWKPKIAPPVRLEGEAP